MQLFQSSRLLLVQLASARLEVLLFLLKPLALLCQALFLLYFAEALQLKLFTLGLFPLLALFLFLFEGFCFLELV